MTELQKGAMTVALSLLLKNVSFNKYNFARLRNRSFYTIKSKDGEIDEAFKFDGEDNFDEVLAKLTKRFADSMSVSYVQEKLSSPNYCLDIISDSFNTFCDNSGYEPIEDIKDIKEDFLDKTMDTIQEFMDKGTQSTGERDFFRLAGQTLTYIQLAMLNDNQLSDDELSGVLEFYESKIEEELQSFPHDWIFDDDKEQANNDLLNQLRARLCTINALNKDKALFFSIPTLDNHAGLKIDDSNNYTRSPQTLYFHSKPYAMSDTVEFANKFYDEIIAPTTPNMEDIESLPLHIKEQLAIKKTLENLTPETLKKIASINYHNYERSLDCVNVGYEQQIVDSAILTIASLTGDNIEGHNIEDFSTLTAEKLKKLFDSNYQLAGEQPALAFKISQKHKPKTIKYNKSGNFMDFISSIMGQLPDILKNPDQNVALIFGDEEQNSDGELVYDEELTDDEAEALDSMEDSITEYDYDPEVDDLNPKEMDNFKNLMKNFGINFDEDYDEYYDEGYDEDYDEDEEYDEDENEQER